MANKRSLKKCIDRLCEELFAEAVAVSLYGTKSGKEQGEATLLAIVKMRNNFVSRVSHPEPGMPAKVYFKDLREKFAAQLSEMADQINS